MPAKLIHKFAVAALLFSPLLASAEEIVVDTLGGAKSIASSPAELLKGTLSGVRISSLDGNPNGQLYVNIRGLNTLRGDSQPLFIVDDAIIGSCTNINLNAFYLSGGTTINGDKLPDYSGRYYASPLGNFNWLSPFEVESIEVLKDVSATSLYGMQGANGVVRIKTLQPSSGTRNVNWHSQAGVRVPSQSGPPFGTGFITAHNLGVNGVFGINSYYNVSGFLRYENAPVSRTSSTAGGLAVNIQMTANELYEFGLNSFLSYGDYVSVCGTNFIGAPSLMMIARYPDVFGEEDSLQGWMKSYDDEAIDYRTVNSAWLRINFLRNLHLHLTGGFDYQNNSRYIWFGSGTSFGKEFSGATGILNNSLMNFHCSGVLNWERNFALRHRVQTRMAFDLNGDINKTNAMCGTEFRNPALRGKGLTGSGSLHAIRKFNRAYLKMGGYAFAGYDYDGNAGLQAALRMDYTSRVDRKPLYFPSAEVFVDLKKLLLSESRGVSRLKITGGYGWAGREIVLPYEYLPSCISEVPEISQGAEPYFAGVNRLLSKEWNVGLSTAFDNDRFSLSFKYYDKKTDDVFWLMNYGRIITDIWVDSRSWTIDHERASVIENKGIEADVDLKLVRNRTIVWTLRANTAYNLNSILPLGSGDGGRAGIVNGVFLSAHDAGGSVGNTMGFNMIPQVHGGLGSTLSLYGFTLDVQFSGAAAFHILHAGRLVGEGRDYILPEDFERGDFLRMDRLTLSYDVPLKAKWIKGVRFNMSGHDLLTFTGYGGWNPDVNSFGCNVRTYGVDYGSFPVFRSAVLGVNVKF